MQLTASQILKAAKATGLPPSLIIAIETLHGRIHESARGGTKRVG